MPEEQWLPAVGFIEYQVSSLGRVKRIVDSVSPSGRRWRKAGQILKPWSNAGYPELTLLNSGIHRRVKVHQLVCRTFHGDPPTPLHEVAHWDGNPGNPAAENLRWATKSENFKDMNRHGTAVFPRVQYKGENHHSSKLTVDQVAEIRVMFSGHRPTGKHTGLKAIAVRFGVSDTTLRQAIKGETWKPEYLESQIRKS